MIKKIRDLATLSEQLCGLNMQAEECAGEIRVIKEEMATVGRRVSSMTKTLDDLQAATSGIIQRMGDEARKMEETNGHLRKSVYDFTVLKKEIHKEILARFESKLKEELVESSKELRHAVTDYNSLRDTLRESSVAARQAASEFARLTELGKAIRNKDFELVTFSKQVESISREKLALQRKIDTLERMVARLRRK